MSHPKFGAPTAVLTSTIDISADDDLGSAVDLLHYKLCALKIPAMTSTAITFMACDTIDGTYVDVYDESGSAVSITINAATAQVIGMGTDLSSLSALRFVKPKTGSGEAADRSIQFIVKI